MANIVFDKARVMAAVDAIAEQTMRMDMCGIGPAAWRTTACARSPA